MRDYEQHGIRTRRSWLCTNARPHCSADSFNISSGLDAQSEQAVVFEALDRLMKDKTSIVIAHHLATIVRADAIFVVKDTQLAERGSHDELLAPADSMPSRTTSSLANPRRPSPRAIELRRRSRSVRLRVRCAPRPRPPRREPPGPCG